MKKYLLLGLAAVLAIITSEQSLAQAVVRTATLVASRSTTPAAAVTAPETTTAAPVVTYAEEMPRFRGAGLDSVLLYVQQHLRYPDDAFIANASGRVCVSFVVNPQCQVEQVKLVKGVYSSLDREALRVVSALPRWSSPARHKGQVVSMAYTIPVTFQMEMAMLALRGRSGQSTAAEAGSNATASFPGGPDSLRAYALRGARRAASTAQGQVLVEFDLDNNGHPHNVKALVPSGGKEVVTPSAIAAAVQLVEQFPAWNPGPNSARARHQMVTFAFGTATLPPLASHTNLQYPTYQGSQPTLEGLTRYIQMQAQYPPDAMARHEQGRVYVSFEVSESGEVEHVQIIGSATPALDAEVLRIIKSLPRATTPPISTGQAVRTSFTLPIAFRLPETH